LSLLRKIAKEVATMTETVYGRRIVPRSALLRALVIVRQIDILFPDRNQTVLEIGGGSGYVGAILAQMGVRYISTDVAQAFYVVQNHVLNAVSDNVVELATDPRSFFDIDHIPAGTALHVPWWKFVVLNPKPTLAVDVVTCNHALLEMHETALGYCCGLAHDLLAGDGLRCFIFEGWGSPIRRPIWQAAKALSNARFSIAFNDGLFPILVRKDSVAAKAAYSLPNAGADGEGEAAFHPPTFIDPSAELTKRIEKGRAAIRGHAKYGVRDYDNMLISVMGSDGLATDDEMFLGWK